MLGRVPLGCRTQCSEGRVGLGTLGHRVAIQTLANNRIYSERTGWNLDNSETPRHRVDWGEPGLLDGLTDEIADSIRESRRNRGKYSVSYLATR
jgi:hypothetical protein